MVHDLLGGAMCECYCNGNDACHVRPHKEGQEGDYQHRESGVNSGH